MATLYVHTAGCDSNDGTQIEPFASIAAADAVATPGTTVHVAPGTYAGGFVTTASGTAEAPITFLAAPGAIIAGHGTRDIVWESHGSYVTVKGFDITGPYARAGFYATEGASHNVVQGNAVHDILSDSSSDEYRNAVSSGSGGAGISMDDWAHGAYGNGGSGGRITGNLVYNIGPSDVTDYVIQGVYMSQSGTVEHNTVYNISSAGLQVWHDLSNVTMQHNTVDNARNGGIQIGASTGTADHITVSDNILMHSPLAIMEQGSTGRHNTYTGNMVHGCGSNPVRLQNGLQAAGTVTAEADVGMHAHHLVLWTVARR